MASGCIDNIGMSPERFIDCPKYPSYGSWLSPRISFSRDKDGTISTTTYNEKREESDPEAFIKEFADFEFRLEDPVAMLAVPADELFSEGKLMPLQLSVIRPLTTTTTSDESTLEVVRSPEMHKVRRRNEISSMDPYLFSPRAPRCSSRWKDILGLKKLYQNSIKQEHSKTSSSDSSNNGHKYLKHFLHKNSKSSLSSSLDLSLSLPLLKDMDNDSVSVSTSRFSHSSSSSSHEHDDLRRFSIDSEKPKSTKFGCRKVNGVNYPLQLRVAKTRVLTAENPASMRTGRSSIRRSTETMIRGVSVDSPRMNSSGKIVFHSLERSSSSPSSLIGGHSRYNKHRGMERSYSGNVRITPVLNVPVCSLRGSSKSGGVFGLFSSALPPPQQQQQKKEGSCYGVSSGGRNCTANKGHTGSSKKCMDRP